MIWLIGNKGMLGSDVETGLKKKDFNIITTDKEVDITDKNKLFDFAESYNISYIINCSAYTNVDKAETEADLAYKINSDGVQNIAEVADKHNAVLIHISTDYVYDGKKREPYVETDNTNPLSVYGKSKLAGEENIKKITDKFFIIRTAWLYGKSGKNFVYSMLNLFKQRDNLGIVNDQYGTPTYTVDLAEIIIKFISDNINEYGIYHFTNEGFTTWYNFAVEIYKMAKAKGIIDKEVNIKPITTDMYPTPAVRPEYSVLSKEKIKKVLGIDIRDWTDALDEFLEEIR